MGGSGDKGRGGGCFLPMIISLLIMIFIANRMGMDVSHVWEKIHELLN